MTDRIGLGIDPDTNDLHLDVNGALVVVMDAEAIGQHVRQRLMTFEKEWFLDTDAGVPWLDEIFGYQYDPALAESIVKAEILDTDGIKEILTFNVGFNRTQRNLIISEVEVLTDYDAKVVI
jgi:hypothetical protein